MRNQQVAFLLQPGDKRQSKTPTKQAGQQLTTAVFKRPYWGEASSREILEFSRHSKYQNQCHYCWFIFFSPVVQEIRPSARPALGKHPTAELHLQPSRRALIFPCAAVLLCFRLFLLQLLFHFALLCFVLFFMYQLLPMLESDYPWMYLYSHCAKKGSPGALVT